MKFFNLTYKVLKNTNYFVANLGILFSTSINKRHRRYVEDYLCCTGTTYNEFMTAYIRLQKRLEEDESFLMDFLNIYKDFLYMNLSKSTDIDICNYFYLALTLFKLLIKDGTFVCGDIKVRNEFTESMEILFDSRLSEAKTITRITSLLKIQPMSSGVPIKIPLKGLENDSPTVQLSLKSLIYYLFMYSIMLIEPSLIRTDDMTSCYLFAIRALNDNVKVISNSLKLEYQEVMKELSPTYLLRVNAFGALKQVIAIYSISITTDITEKFAEIPLERTGYLLPEYRSGQVELKLDQEKLKNSNKDEVFLESLKDTEDGVLINYNIREVVSKDGVKIFSILYDKNFLITALEDYTQDELLTQILFFDITSSLNTSEMVVNVMNMYYNTVREKYRELIKDETKTSTELEVEFLSDSGISVVKEEDKYIYRKKFIPPYKRKLPDGYSAREDRTDLAKRFNIQLEDDEVLVTSFTRNQRYLKDTPSPTENDQPVIKSFFDE